MCVCVWQVLKATVMMIGLLTYIILINVNGLLMKGCGPEEVWS